MGRIERIAAAVAAMAAAGIVVYGAEFLRQPVTAEDPSEKEYLALEMKRERVASVRRYLDDGLVEEAQLLLRDRQADGNPWSTYLQGLVDFRSGRRREGLGRVRMALQAAPMLYDRRYAANIRKELETMLDEIAKDVTLAEYRHFLASKLKGGCG